VISASPKSIDYDAIKLYLHSIDGVVAVHSLHIWSLNVDKTAMTAHLAIGGMLC
jgi:zinc transporter 2